MKCYADADRFTHEGENLWMKGNSCAGIWMSCWRFMAIWCIVLPCRIWGIPQFTSTTHEKAWILRVTVNICKDYWKYQRLRKTVELQENLAKVKENTDFGLLYEVMQLPVKYRNVIYLFYYEELSVAMIADILQRKEATILTWLHRARKQLKNKLEEGDRQ